MSITEEMVARYYQLNHEAKRIEKELRELKKRFHDYFDQTNGADTKAELRFKDYKLQRQIRQSETYMDEQTVQTLEELGLTDCVRTVKRPDDAKIEAAITLGLLDPNELEHCKQRKVTSAIVVREA